MQANYDPRNNYGGAQLPSSNNRSPLLPRQVLTTNPQSTVTDIIYGRGDPNVGTVYGVVVKQGVIQGATANPYYFSASKSSNQTIGTSTGQVTFTEVEWDPGSDYEASAYVVPVDGLYHFDATIQVTATASLAAVYMQFVVNGVAVKEAGTSASASVNTGAQISADLSLEAADSVTVNAFGNVSFTANGSQPRFNYFNGHLKGLPST